MQALSYDLFDLAEGLRKGVLFVHKRQDVSTEIESLFFYTCMYCYNACGLVSCKKAYVGNRFDWLLLYGLRYKFFDASVADFSPDIFKVDLPLVILILFTEILQFLIDLLAFESQVSNLTVNNLIQFAFSGWLKQTKEMI